VGPLDALHGKAALCVSVISRKRLFHVLRKNRLAWAGCVLLALKPVWLFVQVASDVDFVVEQLRSMGGLIDFLATGWGTLVITGLGVLFVLAALSKPTLVILIEYVEMDQQDRPVIEDHVFEDQDVIGPVVLFPIPSANLFDRCVFRGKFSSVFIRVELDQEKLGGGIIGIKNCVFRRCTLDKIAIISKSEEIDKLSQGVQEVNIPNVTIR